jgi:hypothetical protein
MDSIHISEIQRILFDKESWMRTTDDLILGNSQRLTAFLAVSVGAAISHRHLLICDMVALLTRIFLPLPTPGTGRPTLTH